MHIHTSKWNAFVVHSGKLYIEIEKSDYKLTDVTELGPGEFATVKPNEYHRFVTKEDAVVAWEIYYPSELSEDIIRKDVGGRVDPIKTTPSEK
jgi:D-lyxose ketol-isomerase